VTNAFPSGLGQIASEVKFDQSQGYYDGQTTGYGGNNPNIWVGLEASLGNNARNSYNPLYNFRVFQINASITDSSGNVFQLTPSTIATSVWDAPYQSGISIDYAQLIGDLSTWLVGLVGVPTPPNIAITQLTPNGNYVVSNTLIGQWTAYPNGCIIDSAFHNTCNGNGGGLYDKVLRIKFIPTFSTPDVYKITIGTRVERGGCYQNTAASNGAIAYTDYCITEETLTQNYSFSYVYENDAGLGLGDAADTLPNAGGSPGFVSHGSYTGFLYGIDAADIYSFSAAQNEKVSFTVTPPSTADFGLTLYDTAQNPIPNGARDLGVGATNGVAFTASAAGTYFAKISRTSGWGTYSFTLSGSFAISVNPSNVNLGLAGTSASPTSTIAVSSPTDFAGTVDLSASVSPTVTNGPTVSISTVTITKTLSGTVVLSPSSYSNPTFNPGSPANAYVKDGAYATFDSNNGGPGGQTSATYGGYSASLPGGATITSVFVEAWHYETTYGSFAGATFTSIDTGGVYSNPLNFPYRSSVTNDTIDVTSVPPGGWTQSSISTVGIFYGTEGGYFVSHLDWLPLIVHYTYPYTYTTSSVTLTAGSADSRVLTITSNTNTPPGVYTVSVTGSSTGGISFSVPVTATVQDFQVTASPAFLTIPPGQSSTSTITVSPLNGFTGTVTLFVSAPARFTTGFSTNSISGGAGTSILTISLSGTPTPDPATITVSGISGGRTQSAIITVLNPPPNFSVSAIPNPAVLTAGVSKSFTVNVRSLYGFTGNVSLTRNIPSSLTCSAMSSSTVSLTSTATLGSSTFSCYGPAGVYGINVTATGGSVSHFTIIPITIQDFSVSASPTSITVLAGTSAGSTINIASLYGFAGTVNLSYSVSAPGLTCTLSATTIASSGSSNISCRGNAGVYTVTVTGTSGSLTHSTTVTITVQDFTISPSASTVTVTTGQTATSTINIASLNGFAGTISLSDTPLPAGLACNALSPASITLPPSPATATLSCTVTAPGTYTVTILASSGSLSHSTTVSLSYVGDFSISPSSPLTFACPYIAGSTCSTSVPTVSSLNGFSGTVALNANPSPGLSATLSPSSLTISPSASSSTANLSLSAASGGTYTITVTGTSGSLTHTTATMTFMFYDFSVSLSCGSPGCSYGLTQGSTVQDTLTVTSLGGFGGTVNLSVSAGGQTVSLSASSVTLSSGGQATVTAAITGGSSSGTVTITGTCASGLCISPPQSHSASVSVSISCGCGGGGSVAAGTLITLADGTQVPVQSLRVGMQLLSYDMTSHQYVITTITRFVTVMTHNQMVISTSTGKPLIVDQNPAQKLYVKMPDGTVTLMSVTDLKVGYDLFDAISQTWIPITNIHYQNGGNHLMYDIYPTSPGNYIANGYLDPWKT
jgi:hypothetical protein